jgi:small subunit ribosomal protein S9
VIPGAHLEPDLVLEEEKARSEEPGYVGAEVEIAAEVVVEGEDTAVEADADSDEEAGPLEAVLNLAADARYRATGKRKSAIARVTLKPGTGEYTINGKSLNEYFPRATLQTKARRPLEIVGQQDRMDVVAKIHGGGVSAQAGALRHGITRALVEADPNLRGELKRRGFLTRDPRVKERKKAGLKKARKRPQFSKR